MLFLVVVLGAALLLNLCLGEVRIGPAEALNLLFHPESVPESLKDTGVLNVVWQVRLPRLLAAACVGAGLSVSGYLLQSLSRNYLADPYLVGVSSGAGLSVALAMYFGVDFAILPAAALSGGLVASMLVALMSRTTSGISITRLLLAGIALSAICGSLITLVLSSLASGGRMQGLVYWLAGSVSGRGWLELRAASAYIAVSLLAAFALSKPLRILGLGSQAAASLGLNVPLMQWAILLTAVVLCGASVSLAGIVGFVGLIGPYLARSLFGRDERLHLFTAACLGSILVLVSDLAARTVLPGQELPLGTLLSLIGAPFFLWLVVRHKGEGL